MAEIEKIACPACGCTECHPDDDCCFNCGSPLHNYCTNASCPSGDPENGGLPNHYCFCPTCGSKTVLMEAGKIKPVSYKSE